MKRINKTTNGPITEVLITVGKAQKILANYLDPINESHVPVVIDALLGILDDKNLLANIAEIEQLLFFKKWENSSQVISTLYRPGRGILEVCFKGGGEYYYFDVPISVWKQAEEAESIGSFLHKNVKGIYKYKKEK